MPREIWTDVSGYEGIYLVSNLGNIKRLGRICIDSRNRFRFYKTKYVGVTNEKSENIYRQVELWKRGRNTSHLVHRLVLESFVPNIYNKPTVNHKDGDKQNNCLDNLEWATWSENNKHAFDTGLNTTNPNKSGATAKSNEVTRKSIKCVETNQIFKSLADASKEFGIYASNICRSAKLGVATKGFHFVYFDELRGE